MERAEIRGSYPVGAITEEQGGMVHELLCEIAEHSWTLHVNDDSGALMLFVDGHESIECMTYEAIEMYLRAKREEVVAA